MFTIWTTFLEFPEVKLPWQGFQLNKKKTNKNKKGEEKGRKEPWTLLKGFCYCRPIRFKFAYVDVILIR